MKNILRILVVSAAALLPNLAHAGLGVPYTVDANTLHLWHFDEAVTNDQNGFNTNLYAADAVAVNPITLTNSGKPINLSPPYTNTSLGAPGAPTLGTAYVSGSLNAMMYGGTNTDVSPFENTNTGAFTFEALVYFSNNPVGPLPNNMEVICGDNSKGNGTTNRGWQFRINTAKQMEFNELAGQAEPDHVALLPTSGTDIAQAGQWYHMAITFTGLNPTNSDPADVLTFYWTPLDGSRTAADPLATFSMTHDLSGAATVFAGQGLPSLGIGGSSRNYPGTIANGEGLIGRIDEVRISNIARASNAMAFVAGGLFPSTFISQPPTNTLIGLGQTLTLNPLVSGTAVSEQWQLTNVAGGGFTNITTQTNPALVISNITFASSGAYRLVISNILTVKTSLVAQVTVGAAVSELYNTGQNTSGVYDPTLAGLADPHYFLTQSADINALGLPALVWNMSTYPIAVSGGNFSNPDNDSAWIGERANSYTSPAGQYTYRTYFLLDSVDTSQPLSMQGLLFVNEYLTNILINGLPTGNNLSSAGSSSGKFSAQFTIASGFVPGLNTLDFVTERTATANGSYLEDALRVEFTSAVGQALPPGKPAILHNPVPVTVSDANLTGISANVTLAVIATGRPPLTYQWLDQNNAPIAGATNRTLSYVGPFAGQQPTSFSCVVSNASGAVTSAPASLTLVSTNIPPVVRNFSYVIYTNQVLNINFDTIFNAASDQNGFQLIYGGSDATGTNSQSSVVLTGDTLVYTPGLGTVGMDSFTYTLQALDAALTSATGTIFINVVPGPLLAGFAGVSLSAGGLALKGTGGTPGGPFNVLTTTSITNALTNWTVLTSTNFDASGNFNITNAVTPGTPAQFFIIQLP